MFASQIACFSLAIAPVDSPPSAPVQAFAPANRACPGVGARGVFALAGAAPLGTLRYAPAVAAQMAPSAEPAPVAPGPIAPASAAAGAPAPASPSAAALDAEFAPPAAPRDPLEHLNRISYAISQPIDRFILRPAAMVYKKVVPQFLRDGARNFLANLFTPVIFVNDVLQLRPKRVLHTTTRFLLNATLGIGGVFDVAKRHPFGIKAHPNGFADTLGYYGVPAGPYIYLPVIGPGSPRDAAGYLADWFSQPRLLNRLLNPDKDKPLIRSKLVVGQKSAVSMIVGGLDQRAQNDDALKAIKAQSVDPYASLRSSFVQSREGEIAALRAPDGTAPANAALDDPLRDPAETPPPGPHLGAPGPR